MIGLRNCIELVLISNMILHPVNKTCSFFFLLPSSVQSQLNFSSISAGLTELVLFQSNPATHHHLATHPTGKVYLTRPRPSRRLKFSIQPKDDPNNQILVVKYWTRVQLVQLIHWFKGSIGERI